MMKKMNNKAMLIFAIIGIIILIVGGILVYNKISTDKKSEDQTEISQKDETPEVIKEDIDIIDVESLTRPYAVVVNNTPVAVKVQEGLNQAYLVYEIPTEGYTSRFLALYKDVPEDLVIGTIRSARHNFVDFALESDAIFCCYGWSHYAEKDLKAKSIDYIQGLLGGPFYRSNPENLASEHTAYTTIGKLNAEVKSRGLRDISNTSQLLDYSGEDVDLSIVNNKKEAKDVKVHYGNTYQIANFKYDEETKMYTRYDNGKKCIDHNTKEAVTTKNIIVQRLEYKMCSDNYYWDLETIGEGEGYYITNGYSVPIEWSKSDRSSKTKYKFKEGTTIDGKDVGGQEITVSDGRTWIEVQTTTQKITIE